MSNSIEETLKGLDAKLTKAIRSFWEVRDDQGERQGSTSGIKDAGSRSKITGGKHLDGIANLLCQLVRTAIPSAEVHTQKTSLPGYFRPYKCWDIVVLTNKQLSACVELKSQVGSFGNNYNNRIEEVIGASTDLRTAYREGVFEPSPKPWLGYLLILQECAKSTKPSPTQKRFEPHYKVSSAFRNVSYAERYKESLLRLAREEAYDSTCLLLSDQHNPTTTYSETSTELTFKRFASSLLGHVMGSAASTS